MPPRVTLEAVGKVYAWASADKSPLASILKLFPIFTIPRELVVAMGKEKVSFFY